MVVGEVKSEFKTVGDFAVPQKTWHSVRENEADPHKSEETETKFYGIQVPSSSYA